MGKNDQLQTTSCYPDTLETCTLITPETFLFRIGSRGQTENRPPPVPLLLQICVLSFLLEFLVDTLSTYTMKETSKNIPLRQTYQDTHTHAFIHFGLWESDASSHLGLCLCNVLYENQEDVQRFSTPGLNRYLCVYDKKGGREIKMFSPHSLMN